MIVFINDSSKKISKEVRAVIGRYCWRVMRDVWIWKTISIRHDILRELSFFDLSEIRVLIIWSSNSAIGYEKIFIGDAKKRHTSEGFFNHNNDVDKKIKTDY